MSRHAATLWRCPRCGHRFTSRNLAHSCGSYRLADHFKRRQPVVRKVFNRWRAAARACGPVTVYAQKTRIVFQARVRFGGAIVHRDWVEATLWMRRRVAHQRLHRIESFGRLGYGIHFRLTSPADVDPGLRRLLREAYVENGPGQTGRVRGAARPSAPRGRR